MENFLSPENIDLFSKLFFAMAFGMIIGTERVFAHKTAGMRTYALVSMWAALFVLMVWRDQTLNGLTSATGLWISAGIGIATGFGMYSLAIAATILTLFIFIVLWFIEQGVKRKFVSKNNHYEQ